MDTVATDLVKQFINEAFKQHPGNSEGGYQFAMGILALVCLSLMAGFTFYYRDQKRERRQARTDAAKQIDARFDRIEGAINIDLDEFRREVATTIGTLQGKHADIREELAGLKKDIEYLKRGR